MEELKTLSALANGELVWSASFCLSLFTEKKKKKEGDAEGQLFCKIYFDQNLQQE